MWIGLSFLAALMAGAPPAFVASDAPAPASFMASVQVGVGQVGPHGAALVRPRLGFHGSRGELLLAPPLWIVRDGQLARGGPVEVPGLGRGLWLASWEAPGTYAAWLERAAWHSPAGSVSLTAGALAQESVGHGVLLHGFGGRLDPVRPHTGARLDLKAPAVQAAALVNNVVRPYLVAGHLSVQPLKMAGREWGRSLSLGLESVTDLAAPRPVGEPVLHSGVAASLAHVVWQRSQVAVQPFVAAATLLGAGHGLHAGVRLELAEEDGGDSLGLVVEGSRGASGYVPWYFDVAYDAERRAVPAWDGTPKHAVPTSARFGVRATADARLGLWRLGGGVVAALGQHGHGTVYAQREGESLSTSLTMLKRFVDTPAALWRVDGSTLLMAEAAYRLVAGFFAFASFYHGWQELPGRLLGRRTDWCLGIGYGVAAS